MSETTTAGDAAGQAFRAAVAAAAASQPPPGPAAFDDITSSGVPTPDPQQQFNAAVTAAARAETLRGADTTTGAPPMVRLEVGAADDPASRLARLQAHYPDAAPVPGTDNFIYTEPTTGKPMTYAPIGWRIPTVGDLLSLAPEAGEVVGGTVGAIGGGGWGSVPLAAAGAVGGRDLVQHAVTSLLDQPDLRSSGETALDLLGTFGRNLLGAGGGRLLGTALFRGGAGTPVYQAAKGLTDTGVAPGLLDVVPPGTVAQNPGWQKIESGLLQTPFTGGLREDIEATRGALAQGVTNLANRAAGGTAPAANTFAQDVLDIGQQVKGAFTKRTDALMDQALSLAGRGKLVPVDGVRQVVTDLESQLAQVPESGRPFYGPALDYAKAILRDADANGGMLPLERLRTLRTYISSIPDWDNTRGALARGDAPWFQLYQAAGNDLKEGVGPVGSPARTAIEQHDADWNTWLARGGPRDTIAKLTDPSTRADQLLRLARSTAPGDTDALNNLWLYATPEQRATLRGGIINTLGAKPGQEGVDMATFLSNYDKMQPQAKNVIFASDPGLREALDQLATVQGGMKAAGQTRNFSNTAGSLAVLHVLGSIAKNVADFKFGTAAATAGAATIPPITGKLLTSRPFVRWLAGAGMVDPANGAAVGAHIGRLAEVARQDPTIAPILQQWFGAPPPQQQGAQQP